jgi:hypothetical protein
MTVRFLETQEAMRVRPQGGAGSQHCVASFSGLGAHAMALARNTARDTRIPIDRRRTNAGTRAL